MAVPNDRRIVYGTYVVPQIAFNTTSTEVTREEGSTAGRAAYEDWKLDTTVAKRFGGKSTGNHVQVTHDQASDLWTSMVSIHQECDILIPGGAAVSMRTTSTVTTATVKVATASSTTTIEYVIAI